MKYQAEHAAHTILVKGFDFSQFTAEA